MADLKPAPPRRMIVGDLYAGSPHAFPDDCWSGGHTDCRRCGIHLNSFYDDETGCRGPWWMRVAFPEPVPATNQAREGAKIARDHVEAFKTQSHLGGLMDVDEVLLISLFTQAILTAGATSDEVPGEIVAWRERDGDEWVYYDADSDTGKHIAAHQRDWHNVRVFPLFAALATQPATSPMKMAVDRDWLAAKIAADPDAECDAGTMHPEAPQPATSQEGEAHCTGCWIGIPNHECVKSTALAATPTPPTLSVDLREAAKAFQDELRRQGVLYEHDQNNPDVSVLMMNTGQRADLVAAVSAAIAQVKSNAS